MRPVTPEQLEDLIAGRSYQLFYGQKKSYRLTASQREKFLAAQSEGFRK